MKLLMTFQIDNNGPREESIALAEKKIEESSLWDGVIVRQETGFLSTL